MLPVQIRCWVLPFRAVNNACVRWASLAITRLSKFRTCWYQPTYESNSMNNPVYRKIAADELVVVPWKNGGGVTTEVASGPRRAADQNWSWRVSVADVGATGPFSEFRGIDRTIAVIEGGGMDLEFANGRMVALELNQPVDFDGGEAVTGILREEAIRDFNVMADRRYFRARLDIVQDEATVNRRMSDGGVLLIHVLDGRCSVAAGGQGNEPLGTKETAIFEGAVEVSVFVPADARVAIVTLDDISVSARSGS